MCKGRYVMSVTEFEKCCPYAKIVPKKNSENSEIPPLIIANALRMPPGGVWRGYWGSLGLTKKNFFFEK